MLRPGLRPTPQRRKARLARAGYGKHCLEALCYVAHPLRHCGYLFRHCSLFFVIAAQAAIQKTHALGQDAHEEGPHRHCGHLFRHCGHLFRHCSLFFVIAAQAAIQKTQARERPSPMSARPARAILEPGNAPSWVAAYAAMTKSAADVRERGRHIAWKRCATSHTPTVIAATYFVIAASFSSLQPLFRHCGAGRNPENPGQGQDAHEEGPLRHCGAADTLPGSVVL